MLVASNIIRWKLRRCKVSSRSNLKRFYRYICNETNEEIITHVYDKKIYEQNVHLYEQCKSHIDLKQNIYYDYFFKENYILPIHKKNVLSRECLNGKRNEKKLNIYSFENKCAISDEKVKREECVHEMYAPLRVEYLEEYKNWDKKIKKEKGKFLEEKKDKKLNVDEPRIEKTKRKSKDNIIKVKEDEEENRKEVRDEKNKSVTNKCSAIKISEMVEKKEAPASSLALDNIILNAPYNRTYAISSDLTSIYIDNSKHFHCDNGKEEEVTEMKICQYCSYKGICSSRFAFNNLKKGILKVNDKIVYENVNVSLNDDKIELTKEGKEFLKKYKITIIINKPKYYLSLSADNKSNKKLLVRNLIRNENKYIEDEHKCMSYFIYKNVNIEKVNNLYVCGRLDANSSGLLIFTQNTLSSNYLLHKYKYKIEKEYEIKTYNEIKEINLKLLRENLFIDGKLIYKCHVQYIDSFTLKIKLYQGFHKMIRKLCLQSNIKIKSLHRVRIGGIHLNNLPMGKWRFLMPNEFFF
ncbi:RNA pseudouridylate synthase, putative [Plasmodium malariae]|uniref:RNA pseudouridylate synthase, putative n=1 Tax=Plasmodium malariae TaxID=5858 RepID=A0A1C3L332_PLAMA|nr:RNA pseudouridylate synthase, putative [Plasmodium malariae]